MHEPRLLLLDEPTAGVDPQARRDFWDEIHRLADDGMTVLVSTHYMDEAERCHEIAYIFNGELIARGTGDELIADSRAWSPSRRKGRAPTGWAASSPASPGVDMAAPFGEALHVSGTDRAALEAAIQPYRRDPYRWAEVQPTLEDVFIHLMRTHARAGGQSGMMGLSLSRMMAVLAKEFTQLLRDRLTYAMILGIPVIQLLLFGYAINTDPKHLPTAVLVQDQGQFSRSILGALQRSEYFSIDHVARSPAEMDELIERGAVQFAITIPGDFTRRVVRRDQAADPGRGRRVRSRRDRRRRGRARRAPDRGAQA